MKKVLLALSFMVIVGLQAILAQTTNITGKVTDATDGMAIPGVSVFVKGTTVGTVTKPDGTYSLSVPNDATTLVFSFVGMTMQEVDIAGQTTINVAMTSDAEDIDEVIVVAYGTATKEAFTGAASVVASEQLEKRQVSNISNALTGIAAGIQVSSDNGQPGSSANIRIRGVGSFSSSSKPLYVVDGVPFDGDVSSISGNDIESITVLKDAASNALYGARGANGVIMITTKKGRSGKAVVNFEARVGVNQRGIPEYDIMTDPAMYYEKYYEGIYNNQILAGSTPSESHIAANDIMFGDQGLEYNIYSVPEGQYLIGEEGKINPNASLGRVWADDYYLTNDDWYEEIFGSTQMRQEYNLSISGGSENQSTYFSVNYLNDEGIIANSGFERLTTRLKTDLNVTNWMKIGGNIGYTNSISDNPASQSGLSSKNLFYVSRIVAPIYPLYVRDANQDVIVDDRGITLYDYGTGEYPGLTRPVMSIANPASDLKYDKRQYKANILSAKGFANFDIYEGLRLQFNVSYDYDNTNTLDKDNAYVGQSASYGGSVYRRSYTESSLVLSQLLTYKKSFDQHNLDVLIGHETYDRTWSSLSGSKRKLYNPESEEISSGILNPQAYSNTGEYFVEGYLSRLQYDYQSKYFASASYRRDGSSRFHPDHRWGNFWSFGASWLINKEAFLASASWINMLKLKVSYGAQGNDALLDSDGYNVYYPYLDMYEVYNDNDDFGTRLTYTGKKEITWETSYNLNTGVDFALFNNKLNGSLEYFNRKVVDMLFYVPVPRSAGFESYPDNLGSMQNRGVEITINGTILKRNNLEWTAYVNGTHYKNEILELPDYMKTNEFGYTAAPGRKVWKEGGSIYDWFMPIYRGVNEEGQAQWRMVDDEGNETTTTDYGTASQDKNSDLAGSALPDFMGGFGTSLFAYGFDFSVGCTYQIGGKTWDSSYQDLMHGGVASEAGTNWHKDILDSWTESNTGSDIPMVNYGLANQSATSDRFLVSSSYLNINNITVGYTFPKAISQRIGMNSLRLYVAADNVALFSKRKGLDPRQRFDGQIDYRYTPIRTISGGLKVQF